jgi:hypothetical protein
MLILYDAKAQFLAYNTEKLGFLLILFIGKIDYLLLNVLA